MWSNFPNLGGRTELAIVRWIPYLFMCHVFIMERVKGFEPSTSTLARSRSTTELHPLGWKMTIYFTSVGCQANPGNSLPADFSQTP